MGHKTYIGIDNGVTGSIGIVRYESEPIFIEVPVKMEQNYTKAKQNISRIKVEDLRYFLEKNIEDRNNCLVLIERPMVNPTRFRATTSALRALEAVLTVVELLKLPYMYLDSKEWQRSMLPEGMKGEGLKVASKDIGVRFFPSLSEIIKKHKDADGILIAEYARKTQK